MIACFPTDTVKGIWDKSIHGEKVAEDGSTPFEISSDGDVDYTQHQPEVLAAGRSQMAAHVGEWFCALRRNGAST